MNQLKTISDFIGYFESVPSNQWCIKTRDDRAGKHCALGLIGKIGIIDSALGNLFLGFPVTIAEKYVGLFKQGEVFNGKGKIVGTIELPAAWTVALINNGETIEYQQRTPKERMLAALKDLKAAQDSTLQRVEEIANTVKQEEYEPAI